MQLHLILLFLKVQQDLQARLDQPVQREIQVRLARLARLDQQVVLRGQQVRLDRRVQLGQQVQQAALPALQVQLVLQDRLEQIQP